LAEFLVFNDQLSVGQINLVANYLSSEYALPFSYSTTLNLFSVDGLSWVCGTANFSSAWNAGDGAGGLNGANANPFVGGAQDLYLANGGEALFNNSTDTSAGSRINSLRVGTAHAGFVVTGTGGNGTLTASGSKSLTIGNGSTPVADAETGDLTVGEAGYAGTVNWNSSGTLKVEGRLRVGQGGTGVFNQDNGIVTAGDTGGTFKYMAIGSGVGSSGIYNLNNGRLLPGGGLSGSELRQLRLGYNGADGYMAIGDGIGSSSSASIETNDDVYVGQDGGHGELVIQSDGALTMQGSDAEFRVGNGGGSSGLVVQHAGLVSVDALFTIGQGAGAVGEYRLEGGLASAGGVIRVGGGGGNGTFRIQGNASLISSNNLFVAQDDSANMTTGLLELTGSQATFQIARLSNHSGNDETIRWIADASGVSPIVIVGSGGSDRVQLQNQAEVSANSGIYGSGNLMGVGIALWLDMSAISGMLRVSVIVYRSSEAVLGLFEYFATGFLLEDG
jgi:hypothetical protein